MKKEIWTIGHSTHTLERFLLLLKTYGITDLADVRRYPGSRKYPHFNKDFLKDHLEKNGIRYHHFPDLGGRRKPDPHSRNKAWRNDAFRGYADYMETDTFKKAIDEVKSLEGRTALMCSEAVWWRCHRSLLSDLLKSEGYEVTHILSPSHSEEHPYTSPARIVNGKLDYSLPQQPIDFGSGTQ